MPGKRKTAASGSSSAAKISKRGATNTEQWNSSWAQYLHQKLIALEKKDEHPATEILELYGPSAVGDQNRTALRAKMFEVTGKELPPVTGKIVVDAAEVAEYTLPLDAFVAARVARIDDETGERVIDLPRLQQWVLWFKDIVSGGYEKGRERWKIKRGTHVPPSAEDTDIAPGSVEPVKGFTRLSIILWTLHHGISYMEIAMESLSMEKYLADYNMFKKYPEFPVDLGATIFRRIWGPRFSGAFWATIFWRILGHDFLAHYGATISGGFPGNSPEKIAPFGHASGGFIHASGALVVLIRFMP